VAIVTKSQTTVGYMTKIIPKLSERLAKKISYWLKEKGYNTYVKVEDNECAAASQWWKDNDQKWALVRAKWDEVYGRDKDLVLEEKVDNKPLYKFLFEEEGYEKETKIDEVIESFSKKIAR